MQTARLFVNGGSQAVRLPKSCRFRGKEVYVNKIDGAVVLIPKDNPWGPLVRSLGHFTDDFMADRNQPPQQKRKSLR